MRFLVSIAIAGCTTASPPPSTPVLAHTAPIPVACLPGARRDAPITGFALNGDRATLCYGDAPGRACLVVDGAGAVIGKGPWQERQHDARPRTIKWSGGGVYEICAPGSSRCSSLRTTLGFHENLSSSGIVSADGSLAFVLEVLPKVPAHSMDPDRELFGELFEVTTGKRIARVKLSGIIDEGFWDSQITHAYEIIGRQVIVGSQPAGPMSTLALVDPVADKGLYLHGLHGERIQLDPRTLLVLDEHKLSIVDLAAIDYTWLEIPGKGFDDPLQVATAMGRVGASILVAYARPAGVIVFDPKAQELSTPRPLPICP